MGALLCLAVGAAGCAARSQAHLRAGERLEALGQQFLETGQAYEAERRAGRISERDYQEWARFATRFQARYPLAVALWQAGPAADPTARQEALETLAGLQAGLNVYTTKLLSGRGRQR